MSRLGARVAANVVRLAAERGIAKAHLADKAGIGRTTFWKLLDVHETGGRSDPRLSTIGALATALEVEPARLLDEPPRGAARWSAPVTYRRSSGPYCAECHQPLRGGCRCWGTDDA